MLTPIDKFFALAQSDYELLGNTVNYVVGVLLNEKNDVNLLAEKLQSAISQSQTLNERIGRALDILIGILKDDESVPLLVSRLDNYNERMFAAVLLGWFGTRARTAIPSLIDLASGSSGVVEVAKQALLLIGNFDQEALSALQTHLQDGDDGALRELWDLISRAGYNSRHDFQRILPLASRNDNPHIREFAADAIRQLDPESKRIFSPILDRLKEDPYDHVKKAAMDSSEEARSF
jgi:hypothetical protein